MGISYRFDSLPSGVVQYFEALLSIRIICRVCDDSADRWLQLKCRPTQNVPFNEEITSAQFRCCFRALQHLRHFRSMIQFRITFTCKKQLLDVFFEVLGPTAINRKINVLETLPTQALAADIPLNGIKCERHRILSVSIFFSASSFPDYRIEPSKKSGSAN